MAEKSAIIGGTGFYHLAGVQSRGLDVETRYGLVTVFVGEGALTDIVFLPRHGVNHEHPPHRINYRASLKALEKLDVKRILAIATVGSTRVDLPPGSLVLLSQFLDFTKSRINTFFDGDDGVVAHADVTQPYCPALRGRLLEAAAKRGVQVQPEGLYGCMEGPRLETAAEVALMARWGVDVIGMTGVPEAVLARELGLCYASVALVVNYGAGVVSDTVCFDGQARVARAQAGELLVSLMLEVLTGGQPHRPCACAESLIIVASE
jgi:5'-methylthioadenosine phosphorylase